MSVFSSSLLGAAAGGHIVVDGEIGQMYAEGGDFTSRCRLQISQITGVRQVWNHLATSTGRLGRISWATGLILQAIPLTATLVREGGMKWVFTKCNWSSDVLEHWAVKQLSTWVSDHTGTVCTAATVVEGVAALALGQVVLGVAMVTGVALLQLRAQGWLYDRQVCWLEEGFTAMDVAVTLLFGSIPLKCWGLILLIGEVQRVREYWFLAEEESAKVTLPDNWQKPSVTDVTRKLTPPEPVGEDSLLYKAFTRMISEEAPLGTRGRQLLKTVDLGELSRRGNAEGVALLPLEVPLPEVSVRYAHVKESIVVGEEKISLEQVAGRLKALLNSRPFSLIEEDVRVAIADDEVVEKFGKVSRESSLSDLEAYLQEGVFCLVDGWSKGDSNFGAKGGKRWQTTGRVLAYLTDWLEQRKGTEEATRVLLRLGLRGHACAPERVRELYAQYGQALSGDPSSGVKMQLLSELYLTREEIAKEWMLFVNETVKEFLSVAQRTQAEHLRSLEDQIKELTEEGPKWLEELQGLETKLRLLALSVATAQIRPAEDGLQGLQDELKQTALSIKQAVRAAQPLWELEMDLVSLKALLENEEIMRSLILEESAGEGAVSAELKADLQSLEGALKEAVRALKKSDQALWGSSNKESLERLKRDLALKRRVHLVFKTGPLAYRFFGGAYGASDMHSIYSKINKLVPEFGVGQQVVEADAKQRLSALQFSLVEGAWRAGKDSFWQGASRTGSVLLNRAINWWNPDEAVDYKVIEEEVQNVIKKVEEFVERLVSFMPALFWGSYSAKVLLTAGVESSVAKGAIQQEELKKLIVQWWKEAAGDRAETMTVEELLAMTPQDREGSALFQEEWWRLYQGILGMDEQEKTPVGTARVIDLLETWQMPLTKSEPSEYNRSSDRASAGLFLLAMLGIVELQQERRGG